MLVELSTGQGLVRGALKASVVCLALTGAASIANANPVTVTDANIAVYQFTCNCSIGSAPEQAVIDNTSINAGNLKGTGTYSGAINFIQNGDTSQNGNIGTFLASGLGTNTLDTTVTNLPLSSNPFGITTIFVLTGGPTTGNLSGFILHDDGASLYDGTDTAVTPTGSGYPTSVESSPYILLGGNTWTLVYVEANGLPAELVWDSTINFDQTTPIPAALPLFASGLGVLGLFGARRKRKSAAVAAA